MGQHTVDLNFLGNLTNEIDLSLQTHSLRQSEMRKEVERKIQELRTDGTLSRETTTMDQQERSMLTTSKGDILREVEDLKRRVERRLLNSMVSPTSMHYPGD